ncbi:hypothetical protein FBUS_10719 [Fasciolopsis buskii]|uniref:DUF5738 domain-containing protein n=1 Tax=Fasciolopsis buskii TaxID=27845 RepID=A0A8E0RX05_9TREM|nr:hypothetical protein FBUS_10719 [Fasciolopsis buski]
MASTRDSLNVAAPTSNKFSTTINCHLPFRPLTLPRAPTSTLLGSNNQCGGALATEIDTYRRRIQTLLHFFDCIAQHWWDHLYPYKCDLIKRPSRSADEIRSYRTRLVAKLNKFTMRTVAPAAAAIAMMEAHASVKVLPPNLLSPISTDVITMDAPMTGDNGAALLNKACTLARRMGDIEKVKQRLLMSTLTWITSDGRDFALRTQRIALLARHAEPCLIEHFSGVRALITHYYRPRILTQRSTGSHGTNCPSAKIHSALLTEPITATRLTTTNEQIASVIRQNCPRVGMIRSADSDDQPEELQLSTDNTKQESNFEYLNHSGDMFTSLSTSMAFTQSLTGSSQIPMLPSIVLNPLSIDTSQLDWLSYEINQREFNLHVLNNEEPEEESIYQHESPVFTAKHRTSFDESSVSVSMASVAKSAILRPAGKTKTQEPRKVSLVEVGYRTLSTPIATSSIKEHGWYTSSHESEVSAVDMTLTSLSDQKLGEIPQVQDNVIGIMSKSQYSLEEFAESQLSQTPLTAHGEGIVTLKLVSGQAQRETSAKESLESSERLQSIANNLTGKGEEPNRHNHSETKPTTKTEETENVVKARANMCGRLDQKQPTRNQPSEVTHKTIHARGYSTIRELKPLFAAKQIVPRHAADIKHRNQLPIRNQFPDSRDTKRPR